MSLEHKLLSEVAENDLNELVDSQISEKKIIEYKQQLNLRAHKDKIEITSDVSSFANASGGHLIYGMKEDGGLATEICGLQIENQDRLKQQIENILRESLGPRIIGIELEIISCEQSDPVLIIRIPKSWNAPHMNKYNSKFYSRNSGGKYPMETSELRSIFFLSETLYEKINMFRIDRVANIGKTGTPARLLPYPKIVLHLIPFEAFTPGIRKDLTWIKDELNKPLPIRAKNCVGRYNFDGYLTCTPVDVMDRTKSYLQIYSNGIFEAVEAFTLRVQPENQQGILVLQVEKDLIKSLGDYFKWQVRLNVVPPVAVMLSLLNVYEYSVVDSRRLDPAFSGNKIERQDLLVPEVIIESFDENPDKVLQNIFDSIWNASGWPRDMLYDDEGNWLGDTAKY